LVLAIDKVTHCTGSVDNTTTADNTYTHAQNITRKHTKAFASEHRQPFINFSQHHMGPTDSPRPATKHHQLVTVFQDD